jgi:HD-GYP domain-containing protein (c-di-GMP phosphodiesterase class II)
MSQTEAVFDSVTSRKLMDVAHELFAERDVSALCEKVLNHAQSLTRADGGTLYITNPSKPKALEFIIVKNTSLNMHQGGTSGNPVQFAPLPLYDSFNSEPNMTTVATKAAHIRELINISNVYDDKDGHRGTTQIDEQSQYHTQSVLALPLINQSNQLVGVIQLINAQNDQGDVIEFTLDSESILRELGRFASVALDQQLQVNSQRELLSELSSFSSTYQLLPKILKEAQSLTMADAGTIYLMEDEETEPKLRFSVIRNKTLNIDKNFLGSDQQSGFKPILLKNNQGEDNLLNVASYCANTKQLVNIEDAYENTEFCFDGTKAFDESTGYRSQSFLTLPLLNHNNDVIGVLQLINAKHSKTLETVPFAKHLEPLIKGLSTYAAIALNNQILLQDHKDLLDAFIQCIAQAIDAKSPHTSAHCQRVPLLMELIAQAACEDDTVFKDFDLDEDEWYELRVAAWMHDCGKLATPDTVLDKSTKLHTMHDGIDLILTRLSTIEHASNASSVQHAPTLNTEEITEIAEFIKRANKGGEFMREADQEKIRELANIQWYDIEGNSHPLLSKFEVDNLCIPKGTLSVEERQVINNHMQVTIDMLESLPFPKKLKRVPEYAGGHHEKMDGSGFPKGLTREEMSIPARMMSIADIFEALTAKDRPYKSPMPVSVALNILKNMKESNHIDPDLFDLFVRAKVWDKYAKQVLLPEQNDVSDFSEYLN